MSLDPKLIFVGGPGRSGTSFVANAIASHPSVAAFSEVELKIFSESNGLLDLRETLARHYSPTRAVTAVRLFRDVIQALIDGSYGQAPLSQAAPKATWRRLVDQFIQGLEVDGHPVPCTEDLYDHVARRFVKGIARLAIDRKPNATTFLEKTPGNLLFVDFIEGIAPGSQYLHVMRDPRAIAASLIRQPWGPDSIEASVQWVSSYSEAWSAAAARYDAAGLAVTELFLESIVAAPAESSTSVARILGLSKSHALFAEASPNPMNRSISDVPADLLGYLTDSLGDWLGFFGYAPEAVGRRVAI